MLFEPYVFYRELMTRRGGVIAIEQTKDPRRWAGASGCDRDPCSEKAERACFVESVSPVKKRMHLCSSVGA
jgi:hypothetical protein